jgi:chromosome segregation ATPase
LLKEECTELAREQETRSRDSVTSPDEVARLVSATEGRYEARLAEMKRNVSILEKERYESEADWSRKLKEKVKDLEDLKSVLGSATKTRQDDENVVATLNEQLTQAEEKVRTLDLQASEVPRLRAHIQELEVGPLIVLIFNPVLTTFQEILRGTGRRNQDQNPCTREANRRDQNA